MSDNTQSNLDILENFAESEEVQNNDDFIEDVRKDDQSAQDQESVEAAARSAAHFTVELLDALIKNKWDYVQTSETSKQTIIEKTTAVYKKYAGDLPDWLVPYREEIELGVVLAVAAVGVYVQIEEHKKRQTNKDKNNEHQTDQSKH